MDNSHHRLLQYCKEEKGQAVALSESASDHRTKFNALQAINAWDELAGQLYKHKPVGKKQFEKTKNTALFIAGLMSCCQYKESTISKIKQLNL